jgi:CRP-like cAMP-binding protein
MLRPASKTNTFRFTIPTGSVHMATPHRPPRRLTREGLRKNAMFRNIDDIAMETALTHGELVHLGVREPVHAPDKQITRVVFPTTAVLSVVTELMNGKAIEAGTIGREGMSAFPLLMGATTSAHYCYCQVPGEAVIMPADIFTPLATRSASFRGRLHRFLQAYVNMLAQLAACNRLHSIYERCARWLLMTHDRVGIDTIRLSQGYLAMMLGTNSSGVSIASSTLQNAGFIRYGGGVVEVLDRKGLEGAACECYLLACKQFRDLLVQPHANESYDSIQQSTENS